MSKGGFRNLGFRIFRALGLQTKTPDLLNPITGLILERPQNKTGDLMNGRWHIMIIET